MQSPAHSEQWGARRGAAYLELGDRQHGLGKVPDRLLVAIVRRGERLEFLRHGTGERAGSWLQSIQGCCGCDAMMCFMIPRGTTESFQRWHAQCPGSAPAAGGRLGHTAAHKLTLGAVMAAMACGTGALALVPLRPRLRRAQTARLVAPPSFITSE